MSDEPKVYEADLSEFQLDENNANLGTERGTYMIDKSLTTVGAGRSIVADKNGKIPAGNKTLQAAIDAGLDGAIVVETDGKKLVVVKRTDWDMGDEDPNNAARRYAYFDNRSGEVSLDWSPEQLLADLEAGVELEEIFFDWELEKLVTGLEGEPIDPEAEWQGMPEFEQEDLTSAYTVKVHFKTLDDLNALAGLIGQKLTEKTRSIWYPEAEIRHFADKRWVSES